MQQQFINNIVDWADLALIVSYCLFLAKKDKNQSHQITVSVVIAMKYFMMVLAPLLKEISDLQMLRFVWYNGLAACDFAIVAMLFYLHRRYRVTYSIAAKHAYITYSCFVLLQIFTYLDRRFIDSGVLQSFYTYAVPSLELSVNVILISVMLKTVFVPAPQPAKL